MDLGGSIVPATGSVKHLRRRLLFAGAVLLVAAAGILTTGFVIHFDDGGSSATVPESIVAPPQSIDVVDNPPIKNLPVAIPYYNPQRTIADSEPEPEIPAPLRLVIESIGVDAPVSTYGLDFDGAPLVPTGADAAEVVAWYDFSQPPGNGSNTILAGHVTWSGHAVFWDLDDLQPGETISVRSEDGHDYTYEVFANFKVDPLDPSSSQVMADTTTDIITLITCGGSWIPDPSQQLGGDYTERTIVQGKLVAEILIAPVPRATSRG